MKALKHFALLSLGLVFLAGCLGADEESANNNNNTGNGAMRTLTGSLAASGSTAGLSALHDGAEPGDCAADTVIATDASAVTTSAEVDENCAFSIELSIGKSYVISFAHGGQFVATLVFDTGAGLTGEHVTVGAGDGPINLGTITINGNVAIPEIDPCSLMDQDEDGLMDC